MPFFFFYLLKVFVCSGLFYGYYAFALRNKKLHRYNRVYLLAAVVFSWIIPLLRISFERPVNAQPQMVRLLQVVAGGGGFFEEGGAAPGSPAGLDWAPVVTGVFLFVCVFFFIRMLISLLRVAYLIRVSRREQRGAVCLLYSNAKGTPFSFFHYIFWNERVEIDSPEGQRIFRHEWAHTRGKHSLDRLFLHGCLVVGWYNPFVWLILRELNMVHEFLADAEAIEDGDPSSLAVLLLTSAFPGIQASELVAGFLHSPVERRVEMLVQRPPRFSVIRRWSILPFLMGMVLLFALRVKSNPVSGPLLRRYTVVLDAGHGGSENGVMNNIVREKDINLSIVQRIKALNDDPNLQLVFTRVGDERLSPRQRLDYTVAQKPDLFISIHTNAAAKGKEASGGADICLSRRENPYGVESRLFASYLADKLKDLFGGGVRVVQKSETITVLDANRSCPGILVECGYLPDEPGPGRITGSEKETLIAKRILQAVDQYFGAAR